MDDTADIDQGFKVQDHLDDLKKWRQLHAKNLAKVERELANMQEKDPATSEIANKLKGQLAELKASCSDLDQLIADEKKWLKSHKAKKTNGASLVKPLEKDHFNNHQLALFQSFLTNAENSDNASNTIELWDSVPRYSVSQRAMNKMRNSDGTLGLLRLKFMYKQNEHEAVIQAALIEENIEGVIVTTAYYPSANEELIEEVLRKIASIQNQGFYEQNKRSGVIFTLYQLREELKLCGHSRSYSEIVRSLKILGKSNIELKGNTHFDSSNYFTRLAGLNKWDLPDDQNAKWYVEFHPLVTASIHNLSYRQINYKQLMSHKTQLARWLQRYVVHKYTMASKTKPFEIRYSTIKRDSSMLNGYDLERQAIKACESSMEELISQKIATSVTQEKITGERGKIIDVVFTISPTKEFIAEVMAANARKNRL